MNLDAAVSDIMRTLDAAGHSGRREAALRRARQVLVSWCCEALEIEADRQMSLPALIELAIDAPSRSTRRTCAALLVRVLPVQGLVPNATADDLCRLAEAALRDVLLRCGYKFSGTPKEKMQVLLRLHSSLSELMQPLEPTFPNWQGLYAG